MKVIEHFIKGKYNNPAMCEDELVLGDHIIAIIDGVTTKGKQLWNRMSSGCYAKELIVSYLRQDIAELNAVELLHELDHVLKQIIKNDSDNFAIEECPRASVIIYNDLYKEIWSYGDCQCRINEKVYTHSKKIDVLNAEMRAFYLEYYLLQGKSITELSKEDLGRKAIFNNLLMQFEFENKSGEFGYPVLNGMGINEKMIKRYSVKEGDRVVLASDGYPVLKECLKECEDALQHILEQDPMCFRLYKSTKGLQPNSISFDDRAFCRFVV